MNIGFDMHPLFAPNYKNRGIGVYCKNLISEIEKNHHGHVYKFNGYGDTCDGVSPNHVRSYVIRKKKIDDFLYQDDPFNRIIAAQMQHFCTESNIDVMHFLTPNHYEAASLLKLPQQTAKVVTIYDMIPAIFPDHYLMDTRVKDHYIRQISLLSCFDAYIAISDNTAEDLIYYANVPREKVFSIELGIDSNFKVLEKSDFPELKRRHGIKGKFILYVGGRHFTKNAKEVVCAYAKLDPAIIDAYQLVMCGVSAYQKEELPSFIGGTEGKKRVLFLPYITRDELVKLYNMAELFVFPSKYEGFGLPVVEAFACGTAVLTSNNSSISQFAKDCAFLVDPFSIDSISEGMQFALTHPKERERVAKAGLTRATEINWTNTARKTMDAYHAVSIQKADSVKTKVSMYHKKTIAWFSPMPPVQSGIAAYSYEILAHLMTRMNIDVFIDTSYRADVPALTACTVYPYTVFEQLNEQRKYDAIIYQMGASPFHLYIMDFIKKHLGIVVNHDSNCHSLVLDLFSCGVREAGYLDVLTQEFGVKTGHSVYMKMLSDSNNQTQYPINNYYLGKTKRVIALTEYNKACLLEKEVGRDISVIPLYAWVPTDFNGMNVMEIKKKFGFPLDSLIVSSFGSIHSSKRNLEALKAFESVAGTFKNAYFCFVGNNIFAGYCNELQGMIDRNPQLKSRVVITNYVSDDAFYEYLRISDVFVGLRSKGYSASFPVYQALAAGLPCIISNTDVFDAVDNDCVFKVDLEGNEINNIASALSQLLSDDELRKEMGQKSLALAKKRFSINSIVDEYEKAIENFALSQQTVLLTNDDIEALVAYFGKDLRTGTELARAFSDEVSRLNFINVLG